MSTLKDVAKHAGVSMITVSRVINYPGKVKKETRVRVEEAMKKYRYAPNHVAKALVEKRSGIIDVFIPHSVDLSNPFFMNFIVGVSETLSKHMYSFLIRRDREKEHVCDGYIATGLLKDELSDMYAYAYEREYPLVLFGHTQLEDVDCIDVDNVAGAAMGARKLLDAGCKNLVMMNVDEDKDFTADRLTGFRQVAGGASQVIYAPNSVQGSYTATVELLKKMKPDGIFCASDILALGVIQAVMDAGMEVPSDVSVVGFDGLGHNLLSNVHITTIQQPVFEIGRQLAEVLLERLNGRTAKVARLIAPELLEGQSVRMATGI